MSYSTYISSIDKTIASFESVKSEIDGLGLDSLWQGNAATKQIGNLDIISTALEAQITAMKNLSSTMSKIDNYESILDTIARNEETRNNLDTKASNYNEKYQEFTNVINEQRESAETLKTQIETALSQEVNSYSQQFNLIPKTEVVVTSKVYSDAMDSMDKLNDAFDVSAVVSPAVSTYEGFLADPLNNPNFSNHDAWVGENPYSWSGLYGQCTWFAWGKFYEMYGFSPGFTGNGNQCVGQLLNAHSDKFYRSDMPVPGSVFSMGLNETYGHVGIVVDVDYDNNTITIQDGNMNGQTDSFSVAQSDWRTQTYSLSGWHSPHQPTGGWAPGLTFSTCSPMHTMPRLAGKPDISVP